MGNVGPVPNMGSMGMPPQYNRMGMTPSGIQPITSQRRPSTLQYQPNPQNQTSMPGNPGVGGRYMPMCDNPGMQGPQGPVDQKPITDAMGMPISHVKPPMTNSNSPMMDIKPQISKFHRNKTFSSNFLTFFTWHLAFAFPMFCICEILLFYFNRGGNHWSYMICSYNVDHLNKTSSSS